MKYIQPPLLSMQIMQLVPIILLSVKSEIAMILLETWFSLVNNSYLRQAYLMKSSL